MILLTATLCLFAMSSCDLLEPQYAQEIIPDMWEKAFLEENDIIKSFEDQRVSAVELQSLSGYEEDLEEEALMQLYFMRYVLSDHRGPIYCINKNFRSYLKNQFETNSANGWYFRVKKYKERLVEEGIKTEKEALAYAEYSFKLFSANVNKVISNYHTFYSTYEEFRVEYIEDFKAQAVKNTEIVKWELDAENLGDNYTGYLIIYKLSGELAEGYVLVRLIEHDENGEYQYEVLDSSQSLLEIEKMIQ